MLSVALPIVAGLKDAMSRCSVVFQANYNSTARVNVNQGGTWSGKTYSILQVLYLKAIYEGGAIISVVGEDIPALKKGAYRDALYIFNHSPFIRSHVESWNKSDRKIIFKNGSEIEFISLDGVEDAKHGKRQYLFINEATGIDWEVYTQLALRTDAQIYIDYNPSAPFWAHEKLIGKIGVKLFISDHRHNPFIKQMQHDEIEGIDDKQLWFVYARGLTGNLTGIIYPNWQVIPDSMFPTEVPFIGGNDFGYTNDPSVGIKIAFRGRNVYLHECFYETALSAKEMAEYYKRNGFTSKNTVYCDHDKDMIAGLRRNGISARMAIKGANSILAGITRIKKDFKVHYTASSEHIISERQKYMWVKDKVTGKPINEAEDANNHAMDAIRYGIYTHSYKVVR